MKLIKNKLTRFEVMYNGHDYIIELGENLFEDEVADYMLKEFPQFNLEEVKKKEVKKEVKEEKVVRLKKKPLSKKSK